MNIIAVVSQKGGTGKSTVSCNIAVAASQRGLRILVSDTDPQGSLVEWRKSRQASDPIVMPGKSSTIHPMRFAAERAGVDLMIIDTRASSLEASMEASKAADLTLIVVRPSPVDLRAIASTVEALKPLRRSCAFVLNQAPCQRFQREPALVKEAIELLLDYGLPVAPVALHARAVYQHAFSHGLSPLELEPQGGAASEIASLWTYVAGRLTPPATALVHAGRSASMRLPIAPRETVRVQTAAE